MINFVRINNINRYAAINTSTTNNPNVHRKQNNMGDFVTFSGKSEAYSQFLKAFKKLNISEVEFVKKCINSKSLGFGLRGEAYRIPIKGFENFVLKKNFNWRGTGLLAKVGDEFPNENFGQAVAEMGTNIQILKKLAGKSLDKFQNIDNKNIEKLTNNYYKTLSNLPQESYNQLVKQIKIANEKGHRFDPAAGNIMLHKDKLNILDLQKRRDKNGLCDVLFSIFGELTYNDQEITLYKKDILSKLLNSACNEQFPISTGDITYKWLLRSTDGEFKNLIEKLNEH